MKRIDKLRNIGVLAHVDAGKTTLTERMLFAAGRIHRVGEVHDGASAMDTRAVEQAHGVTVSAAATSIDWGDARIAVLDTPGHVDFTWEVERALLAIDGAVVVFSAVGGVEPQTETVWAQADRAGVPRLGFVNKMDALGADFPAVLAMAEARLGARCAALQWPVLDEDGALLGLLDLVEERWLCGPDPEAQERGGLRPQTTPAPERLTALLKQKRRVLLDVAMEAGDPDDALLERYLDGAPIATGELKRLIRRAALSGGVTPMLAGAAYRGVGVAPLLDAVVDYSPSPRDRGVVVGVDPGSGGEAAREPDDAAPFAAMVSKVAVSRFGPMATVRVVSGRAKSGDRALNPREDAIERLGRLIAPHADGGEEIAVAEAGDIVVVAGLKSVQAGDSLCAPSAPIVFSGLDRPEPAVCAAVTPMSAADQERLPTALAALVREDPSLRISTDAETGELLLAGMGELHLQIALEALATERGVAARIGAPRIAYRETIRATAEVDHTLRKQSGGPGQFARLVLRLEPMNEAREGEALRFENRLVGGVVPAAFLPAIETALRAAAAEGPLAGFPALGLKATVLDGAHHPVDSSALAFANAARAAFRDAYLKASPALLEPLARVEVRTPEAHLGGVIADLQTRRGMVSAVEPLEVGLDRPHRIEAVAPMAELWGYVGALRSLTHGRGQAALCLSRYAPAPQSALTRLRRDG